MRVVSSTRASVSTNLVMNIIRKIVIGANPKDAMAYTVGMRVGRSFVSAILEEREHPGRYNVYLEDEEEGITMLWKTVLGASVLVEYDCNFDESDS